MAPPMPMVRPPGTCQLARSPAALTCIAPRTARSTCPPRIIANESAESKVDPPGTTVTVCFPALMSCGSASSSKGNGPMPKSPFSLWNHTSCPGPTIPATSVGRPMPRFTTLPGAISFAARAAISSLVQAMASSPTGAAAWSCTRRGSRAR